MNTQCYHVLMNTTCEKSVVVRIRSLSRGRPLSEPVEWLGFVRGYGPASSLPIGNHPGLARVLLADGRVTQIPLDRIVISREQ